MKSQQIRENPTETKSVARSVWKHLIYRLSPGGKNGEIEYLVDGWNGKKPIFDKNPSIAGDNGYAWVYVADANFFLEVLKETYHETRLGIVLVKFIRLKDGAWRPECFGVVQSA